MKALYRLAAFAAAAVMFGCTSFAAEYDEADNSVSPSDKKASYQTMAVIGGDNEVYYMNTSSGGLDAGFEAAMSAKLEDGEYTLRLKIDGGEVIDEAFAVGAQTPSEITMTEVDAVATGTAKINDKTVDVESRGYYYMGSISGGEIHVNFTYDGKPYSYTHGGELPNVDGKIGVQIDNVPVQGVENMTVTIQ